MSMSASLAGARLQGLTLSGFSKQQRSSQIITKSNETFAQVYLTPLIFMSNCIFIVFTCIDTMIGVNTLLLLAVA